MFAPVLSQLFRAGRGNLKKTIDQHSRTARNLAATRSSKPHHNFTPTVARPNPQSQFLSQSYESILPTSLIYILLLTRDFSSWRPVAVISTARGVMQKTTIWIFKDPQTCSGQDENRPALLLRASLSLSKRLPGTLHMKRINKKR